MSAQVEYDVLIVGAGSSGSVIAARLSENPNLHVGLVEAGPIMRILPTHRLI